MSNFYAFSDKDQHLACSNLSSHVVVVLGWGWAALLPHTLSGATLVLAQTATFQQQKNCLKMHHLEKILRIFFSFFFFLLDTVRMYVHWNDNCKKSILFHLFCYVFQKTSHHSDRPKYRKYCWLLLSLLSCHRQADSSTLKALLSQLQKLAKGVMGPKMLPF